MGLTKAQADIVKKAISEGLDRAEKNWRKVGHLLKSESMERSDYVMDSVPSSIPGHPFVSTDDPKVDEFVALVVDMRDSTKRLKTYEHGHQVRGLKRIYYETSALLPGVAAVCGLKEGSVTEYLGDGALILFGVDKEDRASSVRTAYQAAVNCIEDMRDLMNAELRERYRLPNVDLGAGLAMSEALVTVVGIPGKFHPKAIGSCVWDASKLSDGRNVVHVSKGVKDAWTPSKGGTLSFKSLGYRHVDGFRVTNDAYGY